MVSVMCAAVWYGTVVALELQELTVSLMASSPASNPWPGKVFEGDALGIEIVVGMDCAPYERLCPEAIRAIATCVLTRLSFCVWSQCAWAL
jgi:hypothetical protein